MKYYKNITILFLLLSSLVIVQFIDSKYSLALNIGILSLFLLYKLHWDYSIIKKDFDADIKFQSHKKSLRLFDYFITVFWTLFWAIDYDTYAHLTFLVIALWCFPLVDLIMYFVYRRKKPYTIFIIENDLILNNRWPEERNLNELVRISYNRFNKNLNLDFLSKPEISIKSAEYKTEDMEKLLNILIEKSEHNVYVPEIFKEKLATLKL